QSVSAHAEDHPGEHSRLPRTTRAGDRDPNRCRRRGASVGAAHAGGQRTATDLMHTGVTHLDTDVLIVGAGAAALITALNARQRRVCILWPGSGEEPRTASDYAQGGIAAAVGPGDTPASHLEDTLTVGRHQTSNPAARLA